MTANTQVRTAPQSPPGDDLPILKEELGLNFKLYPYQERGVAYSLEKKRLISGDDMGLGKQQPLYSKVLTPKGWRTMGEIEPGDFVIGSDGKPTKVLKVFPQGIKPVYRVHFSDSTFTDCGPEHLWEVKRHDRDYWQTLTLNQIMADPIRTRRIKHPNKAPYKWEIPMVKPVHFDCNNSDLPIHPYLLGYLLGNGNFCNNAVRVAFNYPELVGLLQQTLPTGVTLVQHDRYYWGITKLKGRREFNSNPVMKALDDLGLRGETFVNKFIPDLYMKASVENRIELLRGLMDSDGHAKANGAAEFDNSSLTLIANIGELVQSLGGLYNYLEKPDTRKDANVIRIFISLPEGINPFKLSFKADRYRPQSERRRKLKRKIVRIEHVGEYESKCISVSNSNGLYVTDSYIVTHNTIQAIATIVGSRTLEEGPCLVICPNSVKINWMREWNKWTNYRAAVLTDDTKQTWHYYYHSKMVQVFIVNYESLKKFFVLRINKDKSGQAKLKDYEFTERIHMFKSVIVDEFHRCKDHTTMQTKIVKRLCEGKEYVLGLTGTPLVNKPADLMVQLAVINRLADIGGSKYFVQQFCQGPKKASNLGMLNTLLKEHCFYRRLKSDVLHDLPDKMRQVVHIDISEEQRHEYMKAELDLMNYLKQYKNATDEKLRRAMRGEVMVRIGILKNITARGKLMDIKDYIDDILGSGQKLILFIHLTEVAKQLMKWYPAAAHILGEDSAESRQDSIDKFQKDDRCQLIVCSIKAAGVGVTLTAASRVAFLELPWTAADTDQCEDRCYRIGQKNSVQCIYFLGRDTIDHYIYKIIQAKREMAKQVTGDQIEIEENNVDDLINLLTK